jgi:hydroxyacylglutathione hydrolase
MLKEIIPICLKNGLIKVNCYLIRTDAGFILIDTGFTKCRKSLEVQLENAGCRPGNLQLIIVTHGDFDHIGNCVYLRNKFRTKVAMHSDDVGMADYGDMFWNRKKANLVMKSVAKLLFNLGESDRFSPDMLLNDSDDLVGYGLSATVITLPGHSKGSIGILTSTGDLFCGDLFENIRKPAVSSIMDDNASAVLSVGKLSGFQIGRVYPGHGSSFLMKDFTT